MTKKIDQKLALKLAGGAGPVRWPCSLTHCSSSINTCSKDGPLILAARQTDREIDDCVGKWQPGEKLTCKWWRVRERCRGKGRGRGGRLSVCALVDASESEVCGVSL